MLAEFREAVHDLLQSSPTLPLGTHVWDVIPDDLAELPCIVVGRPGAAETAVSVVFDLRLEVFVIGRRQQAGDAEKELLELADAVWTVFMGTRGIKHLDWSLDVRSLQSRVLTVAGQDCPGYAIPVESSIATC